MNGFGQAAFEAAERAAEQLRAAGVHPEPLAEYVPERRVLLVKRPATMRPIGEVWRLGVLLVSARANGIGASAAALPDPPASPDLSAPLLYAAGRTTRAAVRLYPGNQSVSREERRDIAAAALKGGFPEGTTVHFDAVPIPQNDDDLRELGPEHPLGVQNGEIRVRWRAGAPLEDSPALAAYLGERIELLMHPPEGA